MANWRESLGDKLAEIDLWAVSQVNAKLENFSEHTEELLGGIKRNAQTKVEELGKEVQSQIKAQIKTAGQKVGNLTRSVWEKRPKN